MAIINRDQFIGAARVAPSEADVPELGGSVWLRPLTLAQVREIQRQGKNQADGLGIYPLLIALSLCDEAGAPFLSAPDVNELPFAVVERLAKAALKLNGMSSEAEADAEERTARKN